jgi:ABC-2 type transport system ATP-binding protein
MVSFNHLTKLYESHTALNDVTFQIPKGEIFGLLGPNGAGKTTLLRLLSRILLPDSGEVLFDGEKLSPNHLSKIGYLPEERGLYPKMRTDDHLYFLAALKGLKKGEAKTRLKNWADKLDLAPLLTRKVEELSKGQQQKIQLIASLIHEPELVILDEPFSGFDPVNAEVLKQIILELKSAGKTILISTHRMDNAEELCSLVAMLNQGKVVLNGVLKAILSDHTVSKYIVTTSSNLVSNDLFDVSEIENNNYLISSKMQSSSNELLHSLMQQTEIKSFVPETRTLKEVFLEKVGR